MVVVSAAFVAAYILGGVTLLPLLLVALLCYSYIALPLHSRERAVLGGTSDTSDADDADLKEKLRARTHEPDAAAGYFAVCREYVPGGLNGKPPERTTPVGEVVAAESPSVYQSMYRSIFDRGKSQGSNLETGKNVKKGRNIFYVVLRHNHLMLFDNAEQIEVRHVIALVHYDIDIYSGGDKILEGELFIRRNCIRLKKRASIGDVTPTSKPFFLFSDNCSDKEDFYHALLRSQERRPEPSNNPPTTLTFDTEDMISLVRSLHASDENVQTRWFNAFVGRLFLALYKTPHVEDHIRMKITRKIARISKPTFITSLRLDEVDMGTSAPVISHPKLREMNVDGGLTLEASVKYSGGIRLVVSAVARLDLGPRFKAREVDLVLAGLLKKLEGHLLIRLKPPPSNRVWLSFEQMPKIELSIEPIVSSRQITYGLITRAIESKVREVFLETLVFPNWDDFPFTQTQGQRYRGGIWKDDTAVQPFPDGKDALAQLGLVDRVAAQTESEGKTLPVTNSAAPNEKNASMPDLSKTLDGGKSLARSSSFQIDGAAAENTTAERSRSPPKAMRAHSFAPIASPIVSNNTTSGESRNKAIRRKQPDAASAMKRLSSRSPESSPVGSPATPMTYDASAFRKRRSHSSASVSARSTENPDVGKEAPSGKMSGFYSDGVTVQEPESLSKDTTSARSSTPTRSGTGASSLMNITPERRLAIEQSINSATAAAKKWGLDILHRRSTSGGGRENEVEEFASAPKRFYGRGQPLPPPGVPLPQPDRGVWPAAALGSLKRKPVAIPTAGSRPEPPQTAAEAPPSLAPSEQFDVPDVPTEPSSTVSSADDFMPSSNPSSSGSIASADDPAAEPNQDLAEDEMVGIAADFSPEIAPQDGQEQADPDIKVDITTPTIEKREPTSSGVAGDEADAPEVPAEHQLLPDPIVEPI